MELLSDVDVSVFESWETPLYLIIWALEGEPSLLFIVSSNVSLKSYSFIWVLLYVPTSEPDVL